MKTKVNYLYQTILVFLMKRGALKCQIRTNDVKSPETHTCPIKTSSIATNLTNLHSKKTPHSRIILTMSKKKPRAMPVETKKNSSAMMIRLIKPTNTIARMINQSEEW
uniref:Uncharacterized protein n=1 Tax=Cacopsylla melanoneura TaxID=428564 RepID=A0A8D9A9L6_9HEMI